MGNASGRMWFVAGVLAAAAVAAYLALVPLTRSLGPEASLPQAITIPSSDQAVAVNTTDFRDTGGDSTFVRALPTKKPKAKPNAATQRSGGTTRSTAPSAGSTAPSAGSSSSSGGTPVTQTPPRKSSIGESGEVVGNGGFAGSGNGRTKVPEITVGSSGDPGAE
jgi:hypothetical protein